MAIHQACHPNKLLHDEKTEPHVKLEKGHDYLFALLSERNANPDRANKIDRLLWEELGDQGAILATDSSGFTRITRKRGTLHFLSMIQKGFAMSLPIIKRAISTLHPMIEKEMVSDPDNYTDGVQPTLHQQHCTCSTAPPAQCADNSVGVAWQPLAGSRLPA